jgi:hypothetical protein
LAPPLGLLEKGTICFKLITWGKVEKVEIIVLGRGCTKCNLTEEMIRRVVSEEGITAQIEKVTGAGKLPGMAFFLTPAVIVDGRSQMRRENSKKR